MRRKEDHEKGILGLLEVKVQFKKEEEDEHVVLDVLEVEVAFKEEEEEEEKEEEEEEEEDLQGVTRKKRTATDLLVLTRLFGT